MAYPIKVNIEGCKNIKCLGDFIRNHNIKLVLFAETHGYLNEIPIQKKIIQNISPDFFLYEMLEESKILNNEQTKRFLNKPDNEDFSFISTYKDLKPTIELAKIFDLPLIGCDIKNMCMTTKDWLKNNFSKAEEKRITKTRELRQSKIINQYTSKGLVFASLGAYHLRKGSITVKNLKENKFIVVHPLFNGKETFLIRRKTKKYKVSYNIKLIRNK